MTRDEAIAAGEDAYNDARQIGMEGYEHDPTEARAIAFGSVWDAATGRGAGGERWEVVPCRLCGREPNRVYEGAAGGPMRCASCGVMTEDLDTWNALMSPRADPEARFPECAPPTIDPATEKGIREIVAKGYQSVCCRYLKDAMGEVDALRNRLRILSDRLHKFTEDMEGDNEDDWIHSSIHEILDAAAVNRPPAPAGAVVTSRPWQDWTKDTHPAEIESCIAALDYIGSMEGADIEATVQHTQALLRMFLARMNSPAGAVEIPDDDALVEECVKAVKGISVRHPSACQCSTCFQERLRDAVARDAINRYRARTHARVAGAAITLTAEQTEAGVLCEGHAHGVHHNLCPDADEEPQP